MKFILVLSIFTLVACTNSQETVIAEDAVDAVDAVDETAANENYRVIGLVHTSETDCPLYIEARLKEETITLYPLNLEERYQRNGMKLKFAYAISKGAQPDNCNADLVVQLSDVTLMR